MDNQLSIDSNIALVQELENIEQAMRFLSPQQRAVVTQYAIGYTYQSIADQLKISKSTVHREMARSLEIITEKMIKINKCA